MARRRKNRSAGEELVEGLLYLAVAAVIVAGALAVLLGSAVLDLVALLLCKLRKAEHHGMRFSSGFIYFAIHRRRRPTPLRVSSVGELLALSATEFEEAVAQSLRDRGYRDVERRGGAGDLGVDITCADPKGERLALQCKRYAPGRLVGSRDLQLFIGMIHTEHSVDRGVYVTTSNFTVPARRLANRHNINLVDGPTLAGVMGLSVLGRPAPVDRLHVAGTVHTDAAAGVPVESKAYCPLTQDDLQVLET